MTTAYIVLLLNNSLQFFGKKPVKRGSYTKDVRLFKIKSNLDCNQLLEWISNNYSSAHVKEVLDWE